MFDWQRVFFLIISLGICLCLAAIRIFAIRRNKLETSIERTIIFYTFIFYICGVIAFTFLPIFDLIREEIDFSINLIPFRILIDFFKYREINIISIILLLQNILGNVLMFMPLGLFACMLNPKLAKPKYILLIGASSSLLIEILQFVAMQLRIVGYRASDIDDIILNTAGCMLGYLLFIALRKSSKLCKLFAKVENRKNIL